MKQLRILALIFFGAHLLFSCSSTKDLRAERKAWNFKNWDQKFKDRAFCLCQLKSFENKNVEVALRNYDKSYYDPLGIAIFDDVLEPQIQIEVDAVRSDSINSIGRYPDDLKVLLQKRNVVNHCLEFYNSNRLDILAKSQKSYWKTISNITEKIHEKIPTY